MSGIITFTWGRSHRTDMPKTDTKLQKLSETIHITVEELRGLGVEGLDRLFMEEYLSQAGQLTDSRQQVKVRHSLKDIIGIVFFAVLAGNDEWTEIADFAVDERQTLEKYLELANGIPSHDTIQRVFFILRPEEVQDMLVNILAQMVTAADGKETHNTGKKKSEDAAERRNLQEFNVMSTEWGISLSSTRIDEKSNEIPQMQKVMKQIDCRGCIVTADAMNAQKATAEAIIKQARGDYCLALKGNHGTVWREVKEYFACEELLEKIKKKEGQYFREEETRTYETVTREYFITDSLEWFEDRKEWEKLQSIGYERKSISRKETGETTVEERYYLCSIKPIAELFGIAVRRHWHIENGLHWVLDIVFREDRLRSKEKNGIHNLGLIRRFVMFIMKLLKVYYNRSMKRIRAKIGRNLEREMPVILSVLKVLYDNDMLDAIDELVK